MRLLAAALAVTLAVPAAAAPRQDRPRSQRPSEYTLEAKAGLPEQTAHFIIEAYGTRVPKTTQLAESVYADFVDVTGLYNLARPKKMKVIIFADRKEFRTKTGSSRSVLSPEGLVATYEQDKVERIIVRAIAGKLFDDYLDHRPASDERWLRRGVIECVAARREGAAVDDSREHWRTALRKDGPPSLARTLGKESEDDDTDDDVATAKRKKKESDKKRLDFASASLVNFLGSWGGRLNFSFMMGELRAGRSLDQAVSRAYPGKFRDFEELYNYWLVNEIGPIPPRSPAAGRPVGPAVGRRPKTPAPIRK